MADEGERRNGERQKIAGRAGEVRLVRACQRTCPVSLPHLGFLACTAESGVVDELKAVDSGVTVLAQGRASALYYIVADGWLSLSTLLRDGRRHLLGFALPGEMVGFSFDEEETLAYTVETLTSAVLCPVEKQRSLRALEDSPALWRRVSQHVLWSQYLLQSARFAHLGGAERLVNLLYSLFLRVTRRRAEAGDTIQIPLTQQQVSDAVGLSLEHACRVRRQLRADQVMTFERGKLTLLDPVAVAELAAFDEDEFLRRLERLGFMH